MAELADGGAVTAVYVLTVPHPGDAGFLIFQALVTAALMTLVRRGGRSADAVIAGYLRAGQAARAEAARRADEREQYRRVHDTALSTLTMVASEAFAAPLATLRPRRRVTCRSCRHSPGYPAGRLAQSRPGPQVKVPGRRPRCATGCWPKPPGRPRSMSRCQGPRPPRRRKSARR